MRVRVHYLGLVRKKIGEREEEFEIKEDSLLSDLLDEIARTHGEDFRRLLDAEKGNIIDPTYIVTVNGVVADQLSGMRTELKNEDQVALMTLISGG